MHYPNASLSSLALAPSSGDDTAMAVRRPSPLFTSHRRRCRNAPYGKCILLPELDSRQLRYQTNWGEICYIDKLKKPGRAIGIHAMVLNKRVLAPRVGLERFPFEVSQLGSIDPHRYRLSALGLIRFVRTQYTIADEHSRSSTARSCSFPLFKHEG